MSKSATARKGEGLKLSGGSVPSVPVKPLPATVAKSLSDDLQRLSDLQDAHEEYAKIEKRVKETMKKDYGPGEYLAKDFRISVEEKSRKSYDIPDNVKAKYETETTATYVEWRRV